MESYAMPRQRNLLSNTRVPGLRTDSWNRNIASFLVLSQYQLVTDGRTDGRTDG